MIKMEKNFKAQEKGYPRKPYEYYDLKVLRKKLLEEVIELDNALRKPIDFENAELECGDVSNVVDYIFEKLQEVKKQ